MTIQTIHVPLQNNGYTISIGTNWIPNLAEHVAIPSSVATVLVAVAPLVMQSHEQRITAMCNNLASTAGVNYKLLLVDDGEQNKNPANLQQIWEQFALQGIRRTDMVIAIGGGVLGDMVGFAAATWNRGIPVLHIPTTLLSMVDSAIGGKTGINLPQGKNLVGAFHQPIDVAIDTAFLPTLCQRERIAGYGEIAKYAFIADPLIADLLTTFHTNLLAPWEPFPQISNDNPQQHNPISSPPPSPKAASNPHQHNTISATTSNSKPTMATSQPAQPNNPTTAVNVAQYATTDLSSTRTANDVLTELIVRSCLIKARVVAADELEQGERAHLNYGHTFGHAIEQVTNYQALRHGEAVGLGMLVAAKLAADMGLYDVTQATHTLLTRLSLPTTLQGITQPITKANLAQAMGRDKKVTKSGVRVVLPISHGVVQVFDAPTPNMIEQAWNVIF